MSLYPADPRTGRLILDPDAARVEPIGWVSIDPDGELGSRESRIHLVTGYEATRTLCGRRIPVDCGTTDNKDGYEVNAERGRGDCQSCKKARAKHDVL